VHIEPKTTDADGDAKVSRAEETAPICLGARRGGRLLVNKKNVFGTMTAWKDQAAMNAYRTGGAHREAMPKLLNWCNEAAVVHWIQESSEIPSWHAAQQHMAKEGKPSKVNHPSSAQVSNHISEPEPSRIQRELKPRLKV
jgi:hypothetical protein